MFVFVQKPEGFWTKVPGVENIRWKIRPIPFDESLRIYQNSCIEAKPGEGEPTLNRELHRLLTLKAGLVDWDGEGAVNEDGAKVPFSTDQIPVLIRSSGVIANILYNYCAAPGEAPREAGEPVPASLTETEKNESGQPS